MESEESHTRINIYRSRWVAVCPLRSYQREVHSVFDELIHRAWGRSRWQPDADVLETANVFIVEMDLPGVDEEQIQIAAQGNRLIVQGQRTVKRPAEPLHVHLSERPQGLYSRTFEFRMPIDPKRIRKVYNNGVLTLIISKTAVR